VEANTGPGGFIEKKGQRNRFVARRAPFRVYDAMEPVQLPIKICAPTMALRFHLPVAVNAQTGERDHVLEIKSGGDQQAFSLTVNVHAPVIPPVGRDSFPYTNWFFLERMAQRHGLKQWSEAHWRMIGRYAALMVHARQNVFWCPLKDIFSVAGGKPVLDRQRLRRIVRIFTNAGMHHIEGGHVAGRTGGNWKSATHDLILTNELATSREGNATLAAIGRELMDEIERNGWRGQWIQHVADEPIATDAADYRILVGMVRKYMPGIPIMDATMEPELVGSVDIWCPQAQEFQKLLRPALFGWGAALYKLDGFLHWGLNWSRPDQDPFEQSVVRLPDGTPLPAGDTHIVYPGKGGPWSSLRLEAQREGFEDLELLKKLRRRDARRAGAIIRRAITGFNAYTKDVRTFRAARRALLEALAV
jgi:hypothetical protein